MPPLNVERRRLLADAAIELLAEGGVHALTHRAADEKAGLPAGTASNYHRSREALLMTAAERVMELHQEDMAAADSLVRGPIDREGLVDLITGSLLHSATTLRARYVAVYELTLEATRRPELRRTLDELSEATTEFTLAQHRHLGLDTTPDQVRQLIALFGGALFSLIAAVDCDPGYVRRLVKSMVDGVLG